ncbi:hypothetical protein PCANC_13552 [Puccinia coronata f. sp. avenae]|uniref:Uncharacterized protein n=1 Tax=Puccinia coronata f. sp. avenae TaxID=200324 RepID=A0A2N5UCP4_9BASI|nr:hypothetical protein PCANC_24868 [Puccinia coronata f. sp. avenae]PLW35171.1 hypothetical protein PCASD_11227 [Puccinia coronata f. sp. avenae]PLW35500.1 hypothetical protein PCANC_13552 [Puccinia coronata f. sp. avenae]
MIELMANRTWVPVAGAGTCLKFQTNWAPAPAQAGTRVQVADDQYMLVIELGELPKLAAGLGELPKLAAGLGELPKLAAGLGELSELNPELGERTSTGHQAWYLLQVRVPVPNLARNGHLHPHQAPAGGYLSIFMGTWWRVPCARQQVPVCHL